MSAASQLSPREHVYLTRLWRSGLDEFASEFQKWFLEHVYLPFLRFSRKRVGIPAPAKLTIHPDGTQTFEWFEDMGAYPVKSDADAACQDQYWMVKPLPLNTPLPERSMEYEPGASYPKAKAPSRFNGNGRLPVALPPDVRTLETLVCNLNKTLNRSREA